MATQSIASGDYAAVIRSQGARLVSLTFRGRAIVEERPAGDDRELYYGDILAPWPNRIAGGIYLFEGKLFNLPINEESRNNALHGMVKDANWTIAEFSDNSVALKTFIPETSGYPFAFKYKVEYSISDRGLLIDLKASNCSSTPAPYGASIHPYLIADSATAVDAWNLLIPASEFMDVDDERLLPKGMKPVQFKDFDFSEGKLISGLAIDHAFKINPDMNSAKVTVTAPSGRGVTIAYDQASKWIQIHTADRNGGLNSRRALAVEPMTCPPDAFNSGIDLLLIEPNQSHNISWLISGFEN